MNNFKVDSFRTVAAISALEFEFWRKTERVEMIGGTRSGSYIYPSATTMIERKEDIQYQQREAFALRQVMQAMEMDGFLWWHPSNLG